jgi:hypothetical protein
MKAIIARNAIFEIIHPYVLSEDDLITVQLTDSAIEALWLETSTNLLKGMRHNAKREFAGNFSPPRGALQLPDFGSLLGLLFGTSILQRQVNDLAFTLSMISVHGAGGKRQTEFKYQQFVPSVHRSFTDIPDEAAPPEA